MARKIPKNTYTFMISCVCHENAITCYALETDSAQRDGRDLIRTMVILGLIDFDGFYAGNGGRSGEVVEGMRYRWPCVIVER